MTISFPCSFNRLLRLWPIFIPVISILQFNVFVRLSVVQNPSDAHDLGSIVVGVENVKKDDFRNDLFMTRFEPGPERWDPPEVNSFFMNKTILPPEFRSRQDDFLERAFFQDSEQLRAPSGADSHLIEILGFLRVPKTGSTSLYQTMINAHHAPLHGCFLGPYNVNRSTYPSLSYGPAKDCAHFQYEGLTMKTWMRTLLPQFRNYTISQEMETTYYSLQIFSMVRDPFDRMISLFNYMKKHHPLWSNWLNDEQVLLMKNGDVGGFLESVYKKKSTRTLQFAQFHNNLEKATRLISGNQPRIFVTVNECFEASLLLLQERFPRFVSPKMIRSYTLASDNKRYTNIDKKPVPMNATLKASLRQQVKVWFPKDFKFYNITVEQFRMHLASSSINATVVESCLRTLDRRAPLYT